MAMSVNRMTELQRHWRFWEPSRAWVPASFGASGPPVELLPRLNRRTDALRQFTTWDRAATALR
jgi:hypothetical protein